MTAPRIISGPLPAITPAQIAAVLGWIAAQAVAFGWMDAGSAQLAVSAGATIIAAAWKIADGYLRAHRALAVAQQPQLQTAPPEAAKQA